MKTKPKPMKTKRKPETLVCGHQVQRDMSGQGHAWRNIDSADLPDHIQEEIEGEIIDGGVDDTDLFVASNGIHYRW